MILATWVAVLLSAADGPRPPAPGLPLPSIMSLASSGSPLPSAALGRWATYVLSAPRAQASALRIAAVAADDGRQYIELWLDGEGRTAARVAVEDPAHPSTEVQRQAVLKLGGKFFILPGSKPGNGCQAGKGPGCGASPAAGPAPAISERWITTSAGRFLATRIARSLPDGSQLVTWQSDKAPPLKLVRVELPGGGRLELAALGGGASSAFPDDMEPVPFPSSDALRAATGLAGVAAMRPTPAPPPQAATSMPAPTSSGCDPRISSCLDSPPLPEFLSQPLPPHPGPLPEGAGKRFAR